MKKSNNDIITGLSEELHELEIRAQIAEARARIAKASLQTIQARISAKELNNNE